MGSKNGPVICRGAVQETVSLLCYVVLNFVQTNGNAMVSE